MALRTIKAGVVGLGSFGRYHARHYASNSAAELVAVADVDGARADGNAQGATVFSDYRDLIGKVEAVSIAVPASAHLSVASAFIEAGVHVLVEKPLALTAADARTLADAATKKGVVLQVGHIERFNPAVEALTGRLANPRRIAFQRNAVWNGRAGDVDVVLDLMIHDIDLALLFAGRPVRSVAASGEIVRSGAIDVAEAWLTFEGGMIATLSASRVAAANERRVTITEPDTIHAADFAAPSLAVTSRGVPGATPAMVALPVRDNLGAEIAAFLSSIANGTPPMVGAAAGIAALEVAERIAASIADADVPARRSLH